MKWRSLSFLTAAAWLCAPAAASACDSYLGYLFTPTGASGIGIGAGIQVQPGSDGEPTYLIPSVDVAIPIGQVATVKPMVGYCTLTGGDEGLEGGNPGRTPGHRGGELGDERVGSPTVLVQLLRLPARCPNCGWAPPIRMSDTARSRWMDADPAELRMTVKCTHRRGRSGKDCGEVYFITAGDYQSASTQAGAR